MTCSLYVTIACFADPLLLAAPLLLDHMILWDWLVGVAPERENSYMLQYRKHKPAPSRQVPLGIVSK
jgi:hypothetical protein